MKTIHIPFLKILGLTGHLEIIKAYLTGSTPFDKIKVIYIPFWPDRAPSRFGGMGGVKGHNMK